MHSSPIPSLRAGALVGTLALILGSCAASAGDLAPAEQEHVAQICKTIMGLSPGEAHYEGCVQSLGATLVSMHDAAHLQGQREACMSKGLKPGSRDFALCALGATP